MKCLVSRQIIDLSYPVRFMYRESPDYCMDSGWRFLSGFEDDAYINDAANILLCDIEQIAKLDTAVVPLLNQGEGSAFERLAEKECFTKI